MSNKRLEEIEINIARHIKNPHYRLNFCKDGYAKILLQRVEEWVACGFLTEDAKDFIEDFNRYTHEFIAYISAEYTDAIVKFDINADGEYYLTFNSDSTNVNDDLEDLVHDYRIIFERCYDYAKSRPLTKIEEGIVYSINDEDQKISFTLDIEAKTLFSLITEYRSMKEEIGEAVGRYAAFIRNTYGIQPNIDRRTLKPLKIKRIDDHIVNVTLVKSRTNTTKKAAPMIFNRTLGKFVQYEEPEIVNYKACWEALRDHVDHVIDRLSENKESSRNASALLSAYLDISNQMKFIEELDLNSHWTKLSTADKIKALQNVDIQ